MGDLTRAQIEHLRCEASMAPTHLMVRDGQPVCIGVYTDVIDALCIMALRSLDPIVWMPLPPPCEEVPHG